MKCILSLLLLFSCSPNTPEEFGREGEARCRSLASVLSGIENTGQLLRAESELKKHFESLVDLMLEARDFQKRHPDDSFWDINDVGNVASLLLEEQLRRIYALEGGREVIERAQHESLVRLDAWERAMARKREMVQ